jgi:hypothetical protein
MSYRINGVPENGDLQKVLKKALQMNCNTLITLCVAHEVEKSIYLIINERIITL